MESYYDKDYSNADWRKFIAERGSYPNAFTTATTALASSPPSSYRIESTHSRSASPYFVNNVQEIPIRQERFGNIPIPKEIYQNMTTEQKNAIRTGERSSSSGGGSSSKKNGTISTHKSREEEDEKLKNKKSKYVISSSYHVTSDDLTQPNKSSSQEKKINADSNLLTAYENDLAEISKSNLNLISILKVVSYFSLQLCEANEILSEENNDLQIHSLTSTFKSYYQMTQDSTATNSPSSMKSPSSSSSSSRNNKATKPSSPSKETTFSNEGTYLKILYDVLRNYENIISRLLESNMYLLNAVRMLSICLSIYLSIYLFKYNPIYFT